MTEDAEQLCLRPKPQHPTPRSSPFGREGPAPPHRGPEPRPFTDRPGHTECAEQALVPPNSSESNDADWRPSVDTGLSARVSAPQATPAALSSTLTVPAGWPPSAPDAQAGSGVSLSTVSSPPWLTATVFACSKTSILTLNLSFLFYC